jgi:hypothetical protein
MNGPAHSTARLAEHESTLHRHFSRMKGNKVPFSPNTFSFFSSKLNGWLHPKDYY